MIKEKNSIEFNVNGKQIIAENIDPELTLAYYLRNELGIRGTKIGCEEGVCGSCTVVIGKLEPNGITPKYTAVNACLVPVFQLENAFIITIEGINEPAKRCHPIQERLVRAHGIQCGFCSPGFIMSAYALLRNSPKPSIEDINHSVKANLCRCTGYRPILEALYSFSDNEKFCTGRKNGKCCQDNGTYESDISDINETPKYDSTQEILFPPSLMTNKKDQNSIVLHGKRITVYIPKTLDKLFEYKKTGAKIISSGLITRLVASQRTDINSEKWITTSSIEELNQVKIQNDTLFIGSALSINSFVEKIKESCSKNTFKAINKYFECYSSPQVANFSTWTGSLVMAAKSKVAVNDLLTMFTSYGWKIEVILNDGTKKILTVTEWIDEKLMDESLIVNAQIPTNDNRRQFFAKLGETSVNDSTLFNICAILNEERIQSCYVGLGGKPTLIEATDNWLTDKILSEDNCRTLSSEIINKLSIQDENKKRMLTASIRKLYEFVNDRTEKEDGGIEYLQLYKPKKAESVGRPLVNYYSERAATGEAIYVNDIKAHDALHLGFVVSTVAHGIIEKIDTANALKVEGVAGYVDVHDVPGKNRPGHEDPFPSLADDTPLFAENGKVEAVGQIIGVIAAKDVVTARRAAKMVKVDYKKLEPVVDLKRAIELNQMHGKPQQYGQKLEEVEKILKTSLNVYEGEIVLGGQEHFYLETQNSLAVPGEKDEIVIHCGTQGTSYTQTMIARALNIASHNVIVKTKRLGGGFGGKMNIASWIACISAICARKFNKPTYGCLSRQDDLIISGKRHPAIAKYRFGLNDNGKMTALHYQAWLNGGWSIDHTEGVGMVLGTKAIESYKMGDAVCIECYPMKTNTCTNTAFRGYGAPQAKLINEGIIRRVAYETKKSLEEAKEAHFQKEGEVNFLQQTLYNDALIECWEACKDLSQFDKRKEEVEIFNRENKNKKRGISISTVRFGLPHPGPMIGMASVGINLDGSVQLTIGGTEMGQGLNMKMIQVCAEGLQISTDLITIVDTSTDKLVNAPETGGSQNADIHGIAVMACCERLMKGLSPLMKDNKGDWKKSVKQAFEKSIPLQCTEYGPVKRKEFNVHEMENPYNTTGACAVEVEIDCFTGYNKLIRVDLVMDVGESLNPAIDIGQIEGAFMQAYGLTTCEKLVFDEKTGKLEQSSAGKYKIPRADMVPKKFNVKLLGVEKHSNTQVYSSKGIGEPPLIMSAGAVHSAIMKAIESYRLQERGLDNFIDSVSPLDAEKVVQLCSN